METGDELIQRISEQSQAYVDPRRPKGPGICLADEAADQATRPDFKEDITQRLRRSSLIR
jgi:hypothetical protein